MLERTTTARRWSGSIVFRKATITNCPAAATKVYKTSSTTDSQVGQKRLSGRFFEKRNKKLNTKVQRVVRRETTRLAVRSALCTGEKSMVAAVGLDNIRPLEEGERLYIGAQWHGPTPPWWRRACRPGAEDGSPPPPPPH